MLVRLSSRDQILFLERNKNGRVGELQYLSGTSAGPRHRLLLGDAVAGGELAAGERARVTMAP